MKTDSELRADVEAELQWDPRVENSGILVAVKDNVVMLGGHVPTYADKWAAENATKKVAGVRAVANDIDVQPTTVRPDEEIAQAALASLRANGLVPLDAVKVIVADGWITLEGQTALRFQSEAAENSVRSLRGVRGVHNNISIRPQASARDIRTKIHAAFKRHADLDAGKVQVSVFDGTVTLTGEVHSWHEREDAENAAWAAPGVTSVKNDLSLSA